jgi:hypothetical protein
LTLKEYIKELHENPAHKDLTPAERHQRVREFVEAPPILDEKIISMTPASTNTFSEYTLTQGQENFYDQENYYRNAWRNQWTTRDTTLDNYHFGIIDSLT